jgi:hypothetical protein
MTTPIVGRTPWSARAPLDPLFAEPDQPQPIPERPAPDFHLHSQWEQIEVSPPLADHSQNIERPVARDEQLMPWRCEMVGGRCSGGKRERRSF